MGLPSHISRSTPPRYDSKEELPAVQTKFHIESLTASESNLDFERILTTRTETTVVKFRKAECIFAQGDMADSVYYVRNGAIKLMVVSDRGKEATIGVLGPGDFCGETGLIDEPVHQVSAISMATGSLLRIQKKSFGILLREHSDFSSHFTMFMIHRSLRIQRALIDHRFQPSEFRLARLLATLADNPNTRNDIRSIPKLSQETLASMVGTTRSRISFFLNKFKRAGLIEYSGGIRVKPGLAEYLKQR